MEFLNHFPDLSAYELNINMKIYVDRRQQVGMGLGSATLSGLGPDNLICPNAGQMF